MKYLLDTHAWYWSVTEPSRLPAATRRLLRSPPSEPLGVSAISVWELCKLVEKGRIKISLPLHDWISASLHPEFLELVGLTPEIAVASTQLPGPFHRDPADQIIVATARVYNVTLVTQDRDLRRYTHVRTLWD